VFGSVGDAGKAVLDDKILVKSGNVYIMNRSRKTVNNSQEFDMVPFRREIYVVSKKEEERSTIIHVPIENYSTKTY
jgi:hypothetical protein